MFGSIDAGSRQSITVKSVVRILFLVFLLHRKLVLAKFVSVISNLAY